jgi:hypothetical protein
MRSVRNSGARRVRDGGRKVANMRSLGDLLGGAGDVAFGVYASLADVKDLVGDVADFLLTGPTTAQPAEADDRDAPPARSTEDDPQVES